MKLREATLLQFIFSIGIALSLWNLVVTLTAAVMHHVVSTRLKDSWAYEPESIGILIALVLSAIALRWALNSSEPN